MESKRIPFDTGVGVSISYPGDVQKRQMSHGLIGGDRSSFLTIGGNRITITVIENNTRSEPVLRKANITLSYEQVISMFNAVAESIATSDKPGAYADLYFALADTRRTIEGLKDVLATLAAHWERERRGE